MRKSLLSLTALGALLAFGATAQAAPAAASADARIAVAQSLSGAQLQQVDWWYNHRRWRHRRWRHHHWDYY